jgi:hypothetical protein
VLLELVGVVFGRGEGQAGRDDALDRRVVGVVEEERDTVERAVLLKVGLEEARGLQVDAHGGEDDGEVVFVSVVDVFRRTLDEAGLAHDLRRDLAEETRARIRFARRELARRTSL